MRYSMTNKILLKFAKKGINLSPSAYKKIMEDNNPLNLTSSIIVKLKGDDYKSKDLVSVSGEIIDKIKGELGLSNSSEEKHKVSEKHLVDIKKTKKPNEPLINTKKSKKLH